MKAISTLNETEQEKSKISKPERTNLGTRQQIPNNEKEKSIIRTSGKGRHLRNNSKKENRPTNKKTRGHYVKDLFLFLSMCMCVCLCLCTLQACKYPLKPEKGIKFPKDSITSSCKLPNIGTGTELRSSGKAACILNY